MTRKKTYFVNNMNDNNKKANEDLLRYQAGRLQSLINEMIECCEDKNIYEIHRFGLPFAEIKCLMLFNGERYLTVKEISQRLDVAKSRVTKLVDSLMDKGLLERINDPKDARIKLISATSAGQKKLEEIDLFHKDIHEKIILQFEQEERKNMLSFFERLRSAMEAVKESFV